MAAVSACSPALHCVQNDWDINRIWFIENIAALQLYENKPTQVYKKPTEKNK